MNLDRIVFTLVAATALASVAVLTDAAAHEIPGHDAVADQQLRSSYQAVSDLVPLPAFIPGMGALFVDPSTLPAGPFLAYDHEDRLVSTIYMIPLEDMNEREAFDDLGAPGRAVLSTDIQFNAGHPGVAEPHYHVVLWHVDSESAQLD